MGKVVVCTSITLDGVYQSPAAPDEDPRDGFTRGGWAAPYAAMTHAGDVFGSTGALLFGRVTYAQFAQVWPARPDSPFTPWLTNIRKYVVSRTLREPLPWANSTLVSGDLPAAIDRLRNTVEKNVMVMGSGVLVQSLMRENLVDEYVLLIHPLVLGSGRRLFDNGVDATLRLAASRTTPEGVVIATYQPAC